MLRIHIVDPNDVNEFDKILMDQHGYYDERPNIHVIYRYATAKYLRDAVRAVFDSKDRRHIYVTVRSKNPKMTYEGLKLSSWSSAVEEGNGRPRPESFSCLMSDSGIYNFTFEDIEWVEVHGK